MNRRSIRILVLWVVALLTSACSGALAPSAQKHPWNLKEMVAQLQKSVVTLITYDLDGNLSNIGSGFFISKGGILVTNHHVLAGAYKAVIKTSKGSQYPVAAVLAENQLADLVKVRIDIPHDLVTPIVLSAQDPAIADRVVVIGSPLGLDQTVSEGIISAIREISANSKVFQLTAPISPGSSGSPALNLRGEVVGVATFQMAKGQNLNFAISIKALKTLTDKATTPSIAEWTIRNSQQGPALAASLCSKGVQFTIQGEYLEALTYFKQAAEASPDDPVVWYGLGSCYVGLGQPDAAIEAYKRPIAANPDNAMAHFVLAMYYKAIAKYQRALQSLLEVIRINPSSVQARFELGRVYGKLERTEEEIDSFQKILETNPNHVQTLFGMGQALGRLGRHDEAVVLFNRASAMEPDNALIYFNIGVTYHHMEQPANEIRAYTRAIRANPRMDIAHYNLALVFLNQGHRKLALDQYEILKSLNTDAANLLFKKIYPENIGGTSVPEPK